jgi:hypothetical protein
MVTSTIYAVVSGMYSVVMRLVCVLRLHGRRCVLLSVGLGLQGFEQSICMVAIMKPKGLSAGSNAERKGM